MRDFEIVYLFIIVVVIFSIIGGCARSPKQRWIDTIATKCYSMGGRESWEDTTQMTILCHRTVIFARTPKLLFRETYVEKEPVK